MKKLVFISPGDPKDRKLWSGTISFLSDYLEKIYEVKYVRTDLNPQLRFATFITRIIKLLSFKKNVRSMAISKMSRKYIEQRVNETDCDIIFAPAVSEFINLCHFNKPLIYLSDATYHSLLNYYIFNASNHDQIIGNTIERNTLNISKVSIFSSQWAANDAFNYYHIPKEKIYVIPFGANIEQDDNDYCRKVLGKNINMLFVGADWKRKGGEIAIETMKWLNKHDSKHLFSIDIVGTESIDGYIDEPHVHYHGFINKNEPSGMEKIKELYKKAHLYIIPTQAECCSMTYSEASKYGVPSLSYNTGGTSSGVKDGVNGFLLPVGATPEDFGKKILYVIEPDKYDQLCQSTHDYYKQRLTWDAWLKDFVNITEEQNL